MVVTQIGTPFAARSDRASLWPVGVFPNRPLLAGIALELALAVAIIYAPPLQHLLSAAALPPCLLLPKSNHRPFGTVRIRMRNTGGSGVPHRPALQHDPRCDLDLRVHGIAGAVTTTDVRPA